MDTIINIIENTNNWFIVAQILGVITICFEFASYQIKGKVKYFFVAGLGNFFWALMFLSMGMATGMATQLTLVIASSYGVIRNFVFFAVFSKNTAKSKEAGLIFLLVMIAFAAIAGIYTVMNVPASVRWIHAVGLAAGISFVVGQYLPGVHYLRITVVIYAFMVILTQTPLNILYGDFRWNIMGILIELSKIISVTVFYIRYSNEPKKPLLTFSKP